MFRIRRTKRNLKSVGISALLALGLVLPVSAAERWIAVRTPHFELYTTNSQRKSIEAITAFEQARVFFRNSIGFQSAADLPVRIIAFRSESEFAPYRPSRGAVAYYQRTPQRDVIVMQDLESDYQTAFHEYTHLIIEHAELDLPPWLNEGLAELYSSLEPRGSDVIVGRPIRARTAALQNRQWLDLRIVVNATQASSYCREPEAMSIFYAQSWLLTHMLALDQRYRHGFGRLVSTLSTGSSTEDAFRRVYSKTAEQIAVDLREYFERPTFRVPIADVALQATHFETQVQVLDRHQSDLALADLQAALGFNAWHRDDDDSARRYFRAAIAFGAEDPGMLYRYAMLLGTNEPRTNEAIRTLQRTLAAHPDRADARYALGLWLMKTRDYQAAFDTLSSLKSVGPDRAYSLFSALAYCAIELHDPALARRFAAAAARYAVTQDERNRVQTVFEHLDRTSQSAPLNILSARQ
jgi:hypothetical protein